MMKTYSLFLLILLASSCGSSKKTAMDNATHSFDKQGHRGCRGLMPENTIPAMLKAEDLGVTTLEMDACISKDKQVVVSHDPFFSENITTTPEGKHLTKAEAARHLLYQMNYDSIRKYDVGLKPHPDFPRQQKLAAYKPLLSELIDSAEEHRGSRSILYNIEIKSKPEGDGVRHPAVEEYADLVMNVIRSRNITPRTTIQSFDPRALVVMHRKYPEVTTSLLIESFDKRPLEEQLSQIGFNPQVYSPHYSLVTKELIQKCHELKIRVIPWTVNTIQEMKRLIALGVDGIISDYPDLFASL